MKKDKNDKKVKNKKSNYKLTHKKYCFKDLFGVLTRQFLFLTSAVLIGLNIGLALYVFIPTKSYRCECKIQCNTYAMDEFQKERIVSYITCNESVDKYVTSVFNAGISHNGQYFTFKDISEGLFSSLNVDTTDPVTFNISYSYTKGGYSGQILTIIAKRAVQELNAIYTKNNFEVINSSFAGEFYSAKRNIDLLIVPLAVGLIVGFGAMFIADGLDDVVYDESDLRILGPKPKRVKYKKGEKLDLSVFKPKSIYIVEDKDMEDISSYLSSVDSDNFVFIDKMFPNKINKDKINFVAVSSINKISKKASPNYLALLGKSGYESLYKSQQELLDNNMAFDEIVGIDYRLLKGETNDVNK